MPARTPYAAVSTRSSHSRGVRSSSSVGSHSGPRHAASIARPGFALDRGDERLPHLVLPHLRFEAHELVHERGEARALTALLQHARHARLTGDVLTTELVHHAVAVALEQRHQ